ncbi:MAG: Rrf2 family transcriptional regulator [Clostridiales bacterium]|jgi:Rrf2 family protein|nr:Rrf2 family transcriptional regulator [Clostridiales bacterium]
MGYSSAFTQGITLLVIINSLAEATGDPIVPTKALAEYANIPFATAVKTLKRLSSAGITATKEGAGGGSMLARPASEITLLDIFQAVEQDSPLFKIHRSNCQNDHVEAMKKRVEGFIGNAADAMKNSLKGVTLKDIGDGENPCQDCAQKGHAK